VKSLLLIIAIALAPAALGAQPAPLTLQAALSETLERNPDLIALRLNVDTERQRPAQERFLMPPMLEAQIWQWPINAWNPVGSGIGPYMLTIEQQVPGRGKRALRQAALQAEADAAAAGIAVRARDILAEVKKAYADLYVARKGVEIYNANLILLRQFADVSNAKYATGRISQQDVLKAVVEISRLHEELVMLDERARIAEARLNTLLARPPHEPIGPLADAATDRALPSPADLQRLALERQPQLKMADTEIASAEARIAVIRSETKPDYILRGGYMAVPEGRDAITASFGITWPTARWTRGRIDAQLTESRARVAAAKAQKSAIESAIRLMVQEAWVRADAATKRASLIETSVVPQSEHTLEVSRVAYQTDRVDFLVLIDNQRVLLEARMNYYRALSDLEQARADLERAVGADLRAGVGVTASAQK
jgi:outer membrane protein, heavy metal efflux system